MNEESAQRTATPGADAPAIVAERVTRHRPCRGCGYDVISLEPSGICPECRRPVSETLAAPLMRDTPKACRQLRLGLRLMIIGSIATVGITLVMLLAIVGFGNLLGGFSERNLMRAMVGFLGIGVLTGGAGWVLMCVSMLSMTRMATVGLALAAASLILGLMLIPVTDEARTSVGPGLVCIAWTIINYALLLTWARVLSKIGDRVGRFGARPQVTRYRWLTTLWHSLALLPSLVLSVAMALDKIDSFDTSSLGFMIWVWFFAWIGHAAWAVYSVVVVWRLSGAVRDEVRAAGELGGAAS
jgi:hypothetical protein